MKTITLPQLIITTIALLTLPPNLYANSSPSNLFNERDKETLRSHSLSISKNINALVDMHAALIFPDKILNLQKINKDRHNGKSIVDTYGELLFLVTLLNKTDYFATKSSLALTQVTQSLTEEDIYVKSSLILDHIVNQMMSAQKNVNWGDFYIVHRFKDFTSYEDIYNEINVAVRKLSLLYDIPIHDNQPSATMNLTNNLDIQVHEAKIIPHPLTTGASPKPEITVMFLD